MSRDEIAVVSARGGVLEGDLARKFISIQLKGSELADLIREASPFCSEQEQAIAKLEEALWCANAAISKSR